MKKIHLHAAIALLIGAAIFLLFLSMQNFYASLLTMVATCLSVIAIGILDIKRDRANFSNVILLFSMSIPLIGILLFISKFK
jgi:hypothetical protein